MGYVIENPSWKRSCRLLIGQSGIREGLRRVCEQLPYSRNAYDLTEEAAVGIAALLIRDLEGSVRQSVLQIGSGGDYLLQVEASAPIRLEVSGVLMDETGRDAVARLREKTGQVLERVRVGLVSVTTFRHGPRAGVNEAHVVKEILA